MDPMQRESVLAQSLKPNGEERCKIALVVDGKTLRSTILIGETRDMHLLACTGYLGHPFKNKHLETEKIFHPCLPTQEGWCTMRSRHQPTDAQQQSSHMMEKLLVWIVFSPLSSGSWMAAWMHSPLTLLVGPNRSEPHCPWQPSPILAEASPN